MISFRHNFVFLANTKAMSSSVHHLLLDESDLVYYRPGGGKHMNFNAVNRRLQQISGRTIEDYFSFGFVRDPVDWIESWYRYRKRAGLKRKGHHMAKNQIPKNMKLQTFIEEICAGNDAPCFKIHTQTRVLGTPDRHADLLIPFNGYQAKLSQLAAHDVFAPLKNLANTHINKNKSMNWFGRKSVPDELKEKIRVVFARDYDLYAQAKSDKRDISKLLKKVSVNETDFSFDLPEDGLQETAVSRVLIHNAQNDLANAALWARKVGPNLKNFIAPQINRITTSGLGHLLVETGQDKSN